MEMMIYRYSRGNNSILEVIVLEMIVLEMMIFRYSRGNNSIPSEITVVEMMIFR